MTEKPAQELRRGWTTGACAAAAARAAYTALLENEFPDPVTITLPGGQRPAFSLARHALTEESAEAAIVKDAGDDPDVTHGALVVVRVRALSTSGGAQSEEGARSTEGAQSAGGVPSGGRLSRRRRRS